MPPIRRSARTYSRKGSKKQNLPSPSIPDSPLTDVDENGDEIVTDDTVAAASSSSAVAAAAVSPASSPSASADLPDATDPPALFSSKRPPDIPPTRARKSQGNTKPYRKAYLINMLSLSAAQWATLTRSFATIYDANLDLLEISVAANSAGFCSRLNEIGLPAEVRAFLPANAGFWMYHSALLAKAAYNVRSNKIKLNTLIKSVATLQTTAASSSTDIAAIRGEQAQMRAEQIEVVGRVTRLEEAKAVAQEEFDERIETIVGKHRVGMLADIEGMLERRDAKKRRG